LNDLKESITSMVMYLTIVWKTLFSANLNLIILKNSIIKLSMMVFEFMDLHVPDVTPQILVLGAKQVINAIHVIAVLPSQAKYGSNGESCPSPLGLLRAKSKVSESRHNRRHLIHKGDGLG
jgi:hypothetical protein